MSDKKDTSNVDTKDKRFTTIEIDPSTNQQEPIAQILTELKKTYEEASRKKVRLSFEVDPQKGASNYEGLFKHKLTLIPNHVLKSIRDTEELIGGIILPARSKQVSLFARPRANRFDVGFTINIRPHLLETMSAEDIESLKNKEIPKIKELLLNCGKNTDVKDKDKRTLSQFMQEIVEDALTFGWFAAEIIKDGRDEFHSFRAVDAGTIYYASPNADNEGAAIRQKAMEELKSLREGTDGGSRVDVSTERFFNNEYTWAQVINERPKQFFTDEEMIVWNLSPSTDVNRSGYPISPLDRIVNAITTHINITTHNKMYFINGRASKNMLVFKSENLDKEDVEMIRAQMNAHINSANSAWRMPVFGIGQQDDIATIPIGTEGKDMEFQYLADLTKRIIFAAYQMSPDEVAAMSYLSRGTNSQSLSESNNEWKLVAARDLGLRPLLLSIEDFFNERLLPKINEEWSKKFYIDFEGLDAETPEREATRLTQDSQLHLSMNDIMDRVEKKQVPLGGNFPLNAAYMQVVEKYFTKGEILEAFAGDKYKGYAQKPEYDYYMGDPTYLEYKQQQQQLAMQQQQMQMQAQQGGQPQQGQDQGQPQDGQQPQQEGGGDLDSALSQLENSLSLTKSEKELPATRKELLKRHKEIKSKIMDSWEKESKNMMKEIMNSIEGKDDHNHDHDED